MAVTVVNSVRLVETYDPGPDLSYLEQDYSDVKSPVTQRLYRKQDRERLAAYNRNEWHMVGVYAEASVHINGVKQTLRSGGLYGIESDSGDYLDEIAAEQVEDLKQILGYLGLVLPTGFNTEDAEWVSR